MTNNFTIWAEVVRLARRAARRFSLLPDAEKLWIDAYEPHRTREQDGECRTREFDKNLPRGMARIIVRLHRAHRIRTPLAVSTVMGTLAHELAHLKVTGHGADHGELTREIAAWMRTQGVPVTRLLHSASSLVGLPATPRRAMFKRAWKYPRPRQRRKHGKRHT
jgi:hypothetical protein